MTTTQEIFRCKCCGHCCHGESTVSITPGERAAIADFLGISQSLLLERYCVEKKGRTEMKVTGGHCIFYGDDGLCMIHPVKPFQCRRWPLHPGILDDESAWRAIKADCPGFDENAEYEEVCRLVREKADSGC